MLSIFKNIFSSSKPSKYIENDALLIDVRSNSEYLSGHIASAKNIPSPLEKLKNLFSIFYMNLLIEGVFFIKCYV